MSLVSKDRKIVEEFFLRSVYIANLKLAFFAPLECGIVFLYYLSFHFVGD